MQLIIISKKIRTPFLETRIYISEPTIRGKVTVFLCFKESDVKAFGAQRSETLDEAEWFASDVGNFYSQDMGRHFSLIVCSVIPYTVFRRENLASPLWNRIALV
jgi:hypothetical protein